LEVDENGAFDQDDGDVAGSCDPLTPPTQPASSFWNGWVTDNGMYTDAYILYHVIARSLWTANSTTYLLAEHGREEDAIAHASVLFNACTCRSSTPKSFKMYWWESVTRSVDHWTQSGKAWLKRKHVFKNQKHHHLHPHLLDVAHGALSDSVSAFIIAAMTNACPPDAAPFVQDALPKIRSVMTSASLRDVLVHRRLKLIEGMIQARPDVTARWMCQPTVHSNLPGEQLSIISHNAPCWQRQRMEVLLSPSLDFTVLVDNRIVKPSFLQNHDIQSAVDLFGMLEDLASSPPCMGLQPHKYNIIHDQHHPSGGMYGTVLTVESDMEVIMQVCLYIC
jgi:hypothetical protein